MADDRNDKPSSAQAQHLGSGKDVLFGWLVRRAAADLGLAEAIAASEAQRAEQIKQLEETLLLQVQELRGQQSGASPSLPGTELGDIHEKIQSLTHRLGTLEESSQRTGQAGGFLTAEIAALTNQITDQRAQVDEHYLRFQQLAATLGAKVRDLEQQLSSRPQVAEISSGEIGQLQSRLQNLVERISHIESALNPSAAAAERDAERARWTTEVDERTAARIRELGDEIREKLKSFVSLKSDLEITKTEGGALGNRIAEVERDVRQIATELNAELGAQRAAMGAAQSRQYASEGFRKELDDTLSKRMGDLEVAIREKLQGVDTHHSELVAVKAQVLSLSQQVADLARRSENDATQATTQAQRVKDHEQNVAARLGAFADRLNEQQRGSESRSAELGSVRLELRALVERMGKMEFAAQQVHSATSAETRRGEQAANRLTADFTALKAELAEQVQNLMTPQALIQGFERTFALKFQEIQKQIGDTQKHNESRDEQLRELGRDLQTLTQRLANAESVSHHTRALMVNEGEQTAQLHDRLRTEIDSFQAQLSRSPWSDAAGQNIGEHLNIKIRELENELAQKMRLLDYRDAEFRELKKQVQSLSQGLPRVGAALPLSPPDVHPAVPSVVIPMDINALRARREELVGAISQPAEHVSGGAPAELQGDALASGGANKDHMRKLQERISADIERARAELREKSGRWKVRR